MLPTAMGTSKNPFFMLPTAVGTLKTPFSCHPEVSGERNTPLAIKKREGSPVGLPPATQNNMTYYPLRILS